MASGPAPTSLQFRRPPGDVSATTIDDAAAHSDLELTDIEADSDIKAPSADIERNEELKISADWARDSAV
jgi:hypothetical protein